MCNHKKQDLQSSLHVSKKLLMVRHYIKNYSCKNSLAHGNTTYNLTRLKNTSSRDLSTSIFSQVDFSRLFSKVES